MKTEDLKQSAVHQCHCEKRSNL